jgi:hypothetical protein
VQLLVEYDGFVRCMNIWISNISRLLYFIIKEEYELTSEIEYRICGIKGKQYSIFYASFAKHSKCDYDKLKNAKQKIL